MGCANQKRRDGSIPPLKFLKKSSGQLIVVGAFRLKFGMVGNTRSPESVFGGIVGRGFRVLLELSLIHI